ncbi:hypothetical protein FNH13_01895 [Ornithinimicrobium ciconiae]|uniref:Uncharacterized protein n=1 Tax=Ornithinimicrobium ciconiae TaxID=2594265 RepID=A0A516G6U2_9MICO|nr:hypothetical protein [Ornithinimicrobium ciconiae]QDO87233.1 hypothetical protein FNH13_01895 [Ornithinimicrobium ciconiae]
MTVEPSTPVTTADLLRHHLLTDTACRRKWQSRAARTRRGTINQAAIAQVLAEWLWDNGEEHENDVLLPRRLKDRVSRALSPAEGPSPRSLTLFILAFDIPAVVADQLWAAHLMGDGEDLPVVAAGRQPVAAPRPAMGRVVRMP